MSRSVVAKRSELSRIKNARLLLLILPLVGGAFYLRSLASWRPKRVFVGKEPVSQLMFSNDGRTLLVVHTGSPKFPGVLTALGAGNGFALLWRHTNKSGSIRCPQFLVNDSQVLSPSESTATHILDSQTGKILRDCGLLKPAVASPDGRWFAYPDILTVGAEYGSAEAAAPTANYRNFATAKRIGSLPLTLAFSPDGKTLAGGVGDQNGAHIELYDVKSGRRERIWNDLPRQLYAPRYATIKWSRNGRFLLSSGEIRHTHGLATREIFVSLWRTSDGKKLASTTLQATSTPFSMVPTILDGFEVQNEGRVLSFYQGGPVFLSDARARTLKSRRLLDLPGQTITAATMSPDGAYLVAGTQSGYVYYQRLK